jgi:hypothetical protein
MAAAALSAAGQVGGAVASGKAAKKVAKIQQKTAEEQMAQTRQFYDDAVTRYQPEIGYGNSALNLYNDAIGNGSDPNTANTALSAFQDSTGYKTTLTNDLAATNASAYAAGLGKSGAALKALQDRGAYDAQQSYNSWLGDVNTSVQTGANAKAALTGAGTTALASNNTALTNSANASSNAALASGASTSTALQNLGNLASNAYQSSYGNGGLNGVLNGVSQFGNSSPIAVYNNPDYSEG